jgi:hypothetical protein
MLTLKVACQVLLILPIATATITDNSLEEYQLLEYNAV